MSENTSHGGDGDLPQGDAPRPDGSAGETPRPAPGPPVTPQPWVGSAAGAPSQPSAAHHMQPQTWNPQAQGQYPQAPYPQSQNPQAQQQPYGPPLGHPGAPPTPRPPSSQRRTVAIAVTAAVVVLVLVGGLGAVAVSRFMLGKASQPTAAGTSEYAAVHMNVSDTEEFRLSIDYDLVDVQVDGQPVSVRDVVAVFIDPQLTVGAPEALVSRDGQEIVVAPLSQAQTISSDSESVELDEGGHWWLSDRYYIAEYLDPATGELLPEPRITAFTVTPDVPTTPVSFGVDGSGVGHFSWEPVPGASRYYFVSVEQDPSDGISRPRASTRILGKTTDTTWTTTEQDQWVQEGLADQGDTGMGVTSMNYAFRSFFRSQDELQDPEVAGGDLGPTTHAYGVIAVTDEGSSPLSVYFGTVDSVLPYTRAFNAYDEMVGDNGITRAADLPLQMPVTMSDGRTVLSPVIYDADSVTATDVLYGEQDDDGTITRTWYEENYRVQYAISGTLFTGSYTLAEPDLASTQEAVRAVAVQVREATAKTGAASQFVYSTDGDISGDVSSSAPEVDYPITATNPLTEYLAANLIAGEERIDVSDYVAEGSTLTPSGVDLWDALHEALDQNPFALGAVEVGYDDGRRVLVVDYADFDSLADREAEQEQLAAEVTRVLGEIITPDMDDEAKARAINSYLVSTAEYDYDALAAFDAGQRASFPHAWTAMGTLIDKRGVCASYAAAFKALADGAGLQSMVVTGVVNDSGGLHAWNKVKLGDAWRMVDSTWNDSEPADEFLFLTDEQSAETRVEDGEWVIDSRLSDYAAR